MVNLKASGCQSFDRQLEPYLRAFVAAPLCQSLQVSLAGQWCCLTDVEYIGSGFLIRHSSNFFNGKDIIQNIIPLTISWYHRQLESHTNDIILYTISHPGDQTYDIGHDIIVKPIMPYVPLYHTITIIRYDKFD